MARRSRKSKRRMNSMFLSLLLTALLLIMSTYAWFTANKQVSITGITAKVSAANGLQISLDGINWGSSVNIGTGLATAQAAGGNPEAIIPTELVPVSSSGVIKDSKDIGFYYGDVNAEGDKLLNVKDMTAKPGHYMAFDIYLKNSSSKTEDELNLASGTYVRLGATSDDKRGVEDTGLEFSPRVGFLLYSNTAVMSAQQSDIVGLTTADTGKVSFWEPNYNSHISSVATSDARLGNSTTSDFKTLALTADAVSTELSNINASSIPDSSTAFSVPTTVRTAANIGDGSQIKLATTTATITTSGETETVSDYLKLKGNAISKVRVYIWLEGQDPDCNDTASTGKYLDFNINLSKPGETEGTTGSGTGTGG